MILAIRRPELWFPEHIFSCLGNYLLSGPILSSHISALWDHQYQDLPHEALWGASRDQAGTGATVKEVLGCSSTWAQWVNSPPSPHYFPQLPRAVAAPFPAWWLNATAACQYHSTRLMVTFAAWAFFSVLIKTDVSWRTGGVFLQALNPPWLHWEIWLNEHCNTRVSVSASRVRKIEENAQIHFSGP